MSASLRGIAGVAFSGALFFGTFTTLQAQKVSPERRGSVSRRVCEIAKAIFSWNKHHVELVAELSSENFANRTKPTQKDRGTLYETVNPTFQPYAHIFRKTPHQLTYAGESTRVFDENARRQIVSRDYVRCGPKLPQNMGRCKVIITGTSNQSACDNFYLQYLREMTRASATQPIPRKHPLSDTFVFEQMNRRLVPVGDLYDYPSTTKKIVAQDFFTTCPHFKLEKTRLSYGQYKKVSCVIAGTHDKKLCSLLRIAALNNITRERE